MVALNTAGRKTLARQGKALPSKGSGGRFPIRDTSDLHKAIRAVGRARPGTRSQVRSFIKRRAAALGASSAIPKSWSSSGDLSLSVVRRAIELQVERHPESRPDVIDLAGKWRHGWIPVDGVAALVKAKQFHGSGNTGGMRIAGSRKGAKRAAAVKEAERTGHIGNARMGDLAKNRSMSELGRISNGHTPEGRAARDEIIRRGGNPLVEEGKARDAATKVRDVHNTKGEKIGEIHRVGAATHHASEGFAARHSRVGSGLGIHSTSAEAEKALREFDARQPNTKGMLDSRPKEARIGERGLLFKHDPKDDRYHAQTPSGRRASGFSAMSHTPAELEKVASSHDGGLTISKSAAPSKQNLEAEAAKHVNIGGFAHTVQIQATTKDGRKIFGTVAKHPGDSGHTFYEQGVSSGRRSVKNLRSIDGHTPESNAINARHARTQAEMAKLPGNMPRSASNPKGYETKSAAPSARVEAARAAPTAKAAMRALATPKVTVKKNGEVHHSEHGHIGMVRKNDTGPGWRSFDKQGNQIGRSENRRGAVNVLHNRAVSQSKNPATSAAALKQFDERTRAERLSAQTVQGRSDSFPKPNPVAIRNEIAQTGRPVGAPSPHFATVEEAKKAVPVGTKVKLYGGAYTVAGHSVVPMTGSYGNPLGNHFDLNLKVHGKNGQVTGRQTARVTVGLAKQAAEAHRAAEAEKAAGIHGRSDVGSAAATRGLGPNAAKAEKVTVKTSGDVHHSTLGNVGRVEKYEKMNPVMARGLSYSVGSTRERGFRAHAPYDATNNLRGTVTHHKTRQQAVGHLVALAKKRSSQ